MAEHGPCMSDSMSTYHTDLGLFTRTSECGGSSRQVALWTSTARGSIFWGVHQPGDRLEMEDAVGAIVTSAFLTAPAQGSLSFAMEPAGSADVPSAGPTDKVFAGRCSQSAVPQQVYNLKRTRTKL